MANLDHRRDVAHGSRGILKQRLLLRLAHQSEQLAGLGVIVVVVFAEIPVIGSTLQLQRRFGKLGLLLPFTEAVRLIAQGAAVIAVNPHGAIAVETVVGTPRRVDRDLVMVYPEPIALGVTIGEQTALQHLVRREANAGDDVGRVECGLLNLGEIVFGVPVQFHDADIDERVVRMRPDLRQVEGVERELRGVRLRHHLDLHVPLG